MKEGGIVNAVILACRTLEAELNRAISNTSCPYPVIWLEAGDHNVPHRRREAVLAALERCCGYDTVLMAMAHCGGALEGIESKNITLVIPCCDDCLTILLGSHRKRKECAGLYLLTKGWMDGRKSILTEYEHCLQVYGESRTRRIFTEMFRNYQGIGLISCEEEAEKLNRAEEFADCLQLPVVRISGTTAYLEALLTGPWDDARFQVIRPGQKIERIIRGGEDHA